MDLQNLIRAAKIIPVTSVALLLGGIGFLLPALGLNFSALLFAPIAYQLSNAEVWRLITPAFLHFSILHVLFNALWTWELGRRIEMYIGSKHYLFVFLFIAAFSNIVQFYSAHTAYFGGLSGVVYGLLGFLLVARYVAPHPILRVADGLFVFMIIFMLLGFVGFLDFFVGGKVANAAHLGGFVAGLIMGSIYFFKQILTIWRRGH